ncbi:HepT-like ribonuclease domain-containing protein [Cohnella lubricantis]|uniref:DUF86 domain-containing protein n=1 Tax=Cohnella lubricantis TaxID=2163172 RepID=A0A841TGQ6_9BACL|nr:HepT-like ribonuclease domain-containing protein [Cohnella lubricantis]MBB6679305.1 DUF86 domain-containing protein [Cohnella lubricantis]MBP2120386.1 uncharacterized protein YutE (UPF0331/DUF86 family) [Cohnella lubricantis]
MYYVNREGIENRLACIPDLAAALQALASEWKGTLLEGLAQERALHLALEIVTDVGSFLIDGFMMRDASSYEDIIDVIAGEGVLPGAQAAVFRELVSLRKPLVQDYDSWPRGTLQPLTQELPDLLGRFAADVRAYLRQELDPWEAR